MSDYMAQLLQNPPDSTAKVRLIERLEDSRDNACLERSTFHKLFSDCIAALAERDALLRRALTKISHDYNCSASRGPEIDCTCLRYDIRALIDKAKL